MHIFTAEENQKEIQHRKAFTLREGKIFAKEMQSTGKHVAVWGKFGIVYVAWKKGNIQTNVLILDMFFKTDCKEWLLE